MPRVAPCGGTPPGQPARTPALRLLNTDARSKRITRQIIRPLFQQGRYAEGIEAGAQAVMDVTREGDVALDMAELSQRGGARLFPSLFWLLLSVLVLSLFVFIARSVILFLNGRATGIFLHPAGRGRGRYAGSSSTDGGGGSSDSGGSFSGGGGSGGGGGASDSW